MLEPLLESLEELLRRLMLATQVHRPSVHQEADLSVADGRIAA